MKRWYHLAIAAAVLIGLLTYLNFDIKHEEEKKVTEEKEALFINANYAWTNLKEFSFKTESTDVTFAPTSKGDLATTLLSANPQEPAKKLQTAPEEWTWQIIKPLVTAAENSDVQNHLQLFKELKTLATVEENAEDLSVFGLEEKDHPLRVRFTGTDEKVLDFYVGLMNPDRKGNYVRMADSRKVLLVEQKLNFLVTKPLNYFRAKTFFSFDNNEVNKIEYHWQNQADIALEKKDRHWALNLPLQAHGDDAKTNTFLADLKAMRIEDYVSENGDADAIKYGFKNPRSVIRLILDGHVTPPTKPDGVPLIGMATTLTIGGDTTSKDGFYVRISGSPTIYKVQTFQLEKVKRDLSFFVEKSLGNFLTGEINNIKIVEGVQKPRELSLLSDSHWALLDGTNKYLADNDKVQLLLRKAKDLQASRFVSAKNDKKYGLEKPVLQLVLSTPAETDKPAPFYRTVFSQVKEKDKMKVYAQGGADNFVFEVAEADLKGISEPLGDLRETQPLGELQSSKGDDQLVVKVGDGSKKQVTLTKAQNGWNIKENLGGVLPKSVTAEALVQELMAISTVKFFVAADQAAINWQATPESDVTVTLSRAPGKTAKSGEGELTFMLAVKPYGQQYYMNVSPSGQLSGYEALASKVSAENVLRLLGLLPLPPKPEGGKNE